jgi:DNA-binding transcriptional ArsR family regulator
VASAERTDTHALLTALRHPLRRRILRAMPDGEPASPRELAAELEEPLSNVSYHVRVLAECGVVELVRTRQVRGSMQHFYRSTLEAGWARFAVGLPGEQPQNGGGRGEETRSRLP